MTPEKQEAIRLINLFSKVGLQTRSEGIECAKIHVNGIIQLDVYWIDESLVKDYPKEYKKDQTIEYWIEVKKYIEQYENLQNL